MAIEERKLTPAGQGNLQQIKLGIPVVEALNRMAEDPMGENEKLLLRILEQNKDTEYGRKYGFADIHSIEEYQKKVPVSVYDDYAGYILRMSEDGEENLITSGKVVHYNKSSGTVGNPKRIPLTEEAFQVFQKYNGPYRMGLVAKELGEDWINGRNMSIAESIAEIQHVKSGVTYGALSVKMIGEFRPYLGMSFTSPDEAIYPESETNTRYLHARFGLMDQDLTNMAANFLGFLLEVLRYMEQNWELLVNDIEQGTIDLGIKMSEEVRSSLLKKIQPMPERAQELRGIFMQGFEEPIVPKLWPHAQFLTGVGSGGFKVYADKIKEKYMGEKRIGSNKIAEKTLTENLYTDKTKKLNTSFIAYNNENENIELKTSKSVPKDKIQIKVRYDADNVKDIHIDKNLYNDDEYIGDDIYIDDDYDENSMDNVALENMTQTDESESAQKNPTSQEFFISAVGRMSDIEYVLSYKDEILKNIKERKIYNYVYPQIISVEITVNPENKNLMKI